MPIVSNMERVVVFCVEHLLSEIEILKEDEVEGGQEEVVPLQTGTREACDLQAVSKTLLNFHKIAHSMIDNETKARENKERRM